MTPHREEAESMVQIRKDMTLREKLMWIYAQARAPLPWTLDRERVLEILLDDLLAALDSVAAAEQRGAARALRDAAADCLESLMGNRVAKWLNARADALSTGSTKTEKAKG
jgi:hypothetical protein